MMRLRRMIGATILEIRISIPATTAIISLRLSLLLCDVCGINTPLLRVALLLLIALTGSGVGQTIRVTTWNLQWFPNGSAKVAPPEKQTRTIQTAARALIALNPDVLLLQEIRNREACQRLAKALAPLKYEVLVCSEFREGPENEIGAQQVAILAKKSADGAWAEVWKTKGVVDPPRGFAFAVIPFGKKQVGFYSVHLKSNLVHGNRTEEMALNILKRETASEQLLVHARQVARDYPRMKGIIAAGDFNTNRDQDRFGREGTLQVFVDAGYVDPVGALPYAARITCPGQGKYPDATFDYIFARRLKPVARPEILKSPAADHFPVTVEFRVVE
jgi:endonuclease/exonuclease/phosphatase family metal-dependent hydrolase